MTNIFRQMIEPGIYFDMDEATYHAADGLSCSGIKHLTVSKLNYWHRNLNPGREPGPALHRPPIFFAAC